MNQPPLIKYNLKDRERKHTGKPRDFNIPLLMDSINGDATQERIKSRGMLGYFGHSPRLLLGLSPKESGVISGKYTEIDAAVLTTSLKLYSNGEVEHQPVFLDNASGRRASQMYENGVGGFSSVIDEETNTFYGFDYVYEPNFNGNRGFEVSLDSVNDESQEPVELTFDSVVELSHKEEIAFMQALIDKQAEENSGLKVSLDSASTSLDSANSEINELIDSIESGNAGKEIEPELPISIDVDKTDAILDDINGFRSEVLPTLDSASNKKVIENKEADHFITRMGYA